MEEKEVLAMDADEMNDQMDTVVAEDDEHGAQLDEVMEAEIDDSSFDGVDLPSFVMPEEPGLYEITAEDAQYLPCPVLDALFLYKEQAVQVLEHMSDCAVVKYFGDAEPSDEMKKIESKIEDSRIQLDKFRKERSVRAYQAKTIGCKKCGSQLAKEYLTDDTCPLCGNDLRPASTIEQEGVLLNKIYSYESEFKELGMINQVKNGTLRYLLRVV